jgi:hypothetical protein
VARQIPCGHPTGRAGTNNDDVVHFRGFSDLH